MIKFVEINKGLKNMDIIKKDNILKTREVLQNLKSLYDERGVEGIGHLFNEMLKNPEKRVARVVKWALKVVYKIDTCKKDCFEDLQSKKKLVCNCNNEEFNIVLADIVSNIGNA